MDFLVFCLSILISTLAPVVGDPAISISETVTYSLRLPVITKTWPPIWEWRTTETVEGIEFSAHSVQSLFDDQGRLHLFWDMNLLSSPHFVYHAYRSDNGWIDAYPVAQSLGNSSLGQKPVLDGAGTLHLIWPNDVISNTQTVYRLLYAGFRNDSWSQAEEVYVSTSRSSGWLQVDTSQQLHVYIRDDADVKQLKHGMKTPSGWIWLDSIELPDSVHWIWPDHSDCVRVFTGVSADETKYSRWCAGNYDPYESKISGVDIRRRDTLLGGENALHVFWTETISIPGGSATAAYHQYLGENQTPLPAEIPSGYDSIGSLYGNVDATRWFVLAWSVGSDSHVALWDGSTFVGTATAPASIGFWTSLAGVSADRSSGNICVIRRQGLDETHEIACAKLR